MSDEIQVWNDLFSAFAKDCPPEVRKKITETWQQQERQNNPAIKQDERRAEIYEQLETAESKRDYKALFKAQSELDTLDAQSAPQVETPEQNSQSDADRIAAEMEELMQHPSQNRKRIDELAGEYDRVVAQQARPQDDDMVISFRTGQAKVLRRGE